MSPLSSLLARELTDLGRFCGLLEEERQALTGAHPDRLPDLASEKASLAGRLSQLEAQRDDLLAKAGLAKGRNGMDGWLASHPKAADERRQWRDLLELAATARQGNETNGRLINLLLKHNQDALSALVANGAESIYGADGQTRGMATEKRSFGAV